MDILFPIIILFQFYFLNKIENAFIFILFMGTISGAYFISRGINGVGGFSLIIGVLLIWKEIIKLKFILFKEYLPLLLILGSFGISAFINKNGIDYDLKFFTIFINGTLGFIVISIFFRNGYKIRFEILGAAFLILGAFMLRLCININDLPGPEKLFDYGYMRNQTNVYTAGALVKIDDFTISYHVPGFLALIGLVFILIANGLSFSISNLFFIFVSFIIIYYSGGRQNLLGFILLILFFLGTTKNYSFFYKFYLFSIFSVVIGFAFSFTKSDLLQSIIYSDNISSAIEAGGRSIHFLKGMNYFFENQLTGIGIGFHNYGNKALWPHNLLIEILAEVGMLGALIILLTLTYSIVKNTKNKKINIKCLLLIIPFFIRAMISGSLTTNVIIFSFLFSIYFWPLESKSKQTKI
jgi:O-antigen ligase